MNDQLLKVFCADEPMETMVISGQVRMLCFGGSFRVFYVNPESIPKVEISRNASEAPEHWRRQITVGRPGRITLTNDPEKGDHARGVYKRINVAAMESHAKSEFAAGLVMREYTIPLMRKNSEKDCMHFAGDLDFVGD